MSRPWYRGRGEQERGRKKARGIKKGTGREQGIKKRAEKEQEESKGIKKGTEKNRKRYKREDEMEGEKNGGWQFSICDKRVTVYSGDAPKGPVVYLNTAGQEGEAVCKLLRDMGRRDFTLVTVGGLTWYCDMAPWDMPPVSADALPFRGGADDYLQILEEEIVPAAEKFVPGPIAWRGLAGYSLAGLFAVYSSYRVRAFHRIASISGSLWYPGFREYALSHEMAGKPTHAYFSLGDREDRTGNPYMRTVREQTEAIAALRREQGIEVMYQLNPGNHFKNTARRTAAGIAWMLAV